MVPDGLVAGGSRMTESVPLTDNSVGRARRAGEQDACRGTAGGVEGDEANSAVEM